LDEGITAAVKRQPSAQSGVRHCGIAQQVLECVADNEDRHVRGAYGRQIAVGPVVAEVLEGSHKALAVVGQTDEVGDGRSARLPVERSFGLRILFQAGAVWRLGNPDESAFARSRAPKVIENEGHPENELAKLPVSVRFLQRGRDGIRITF
jgi:hypothetical protein